MTEDNLHRFEKLLMHFAPTADDFTGNPPEAMITAASRKAFAISTAAALPPGPLGLFTILPELMAVTKIQINLIHGIAAYYGKKGQVNTTLILLVFANEAGLAVGRRIVTHVGAKILVRVLGEQSARPLARSIAARIGARLTQKALGRWIPLLLAPVFGLFSKRMTERIGAEAIKLFSQDIELLEAPPHPSDDNPSPDKAAGPESGTEGNRVSKDKSF